MNHNDDGEMFEHIDGEMNGENHENIVVQNLEEMEFVEVFLVKFFMYDIPTSSEQYQFYIFNNIYDCKLFLEKINYTDIFLKTDEQIHKEFFIGKCPKEYLNAEKNNTLSIVYSIDSISIDNVRPTIKIMNNNAFNIDTIIQQKLRSIEHFAEFLENQPPETIRNLLNTVSVKKYDNVDGNGEITHIDCERFDKEFNELYDVMLGFGRVVCSTNDMHTYIIHNIGFFENTLYEFK